MDAFDLLVHSVCQFVLQADTQEEAYVWGGDRRGGAQVARNYICPQVWNYPGRLAEHPSALKTVGKQMNRNEGLAECDEFFKPLRAKTRCKGWTREEVYAAPIEAFRECEQRFLKKNIPIQGEAAARRSLNDLYFGSVPNFRPTEAVKLYEYVGATAVLDPCAGWGGRCFAAMKLDIPYIGFDTNDNLRKAYAGLISKYQKKALTLVYFEDSSKADFSRFEYDCVFTSPPYWDRELYENMPAYETKQQFNENFLKPMIENSYKHLKPGGTLCLNVPQKMYDVIKDMFRECDDKIEYVNNHRSATTKYKEYIYIWRKNT